MQRKIPAHFKKTLIAVSIHPLLIPSYTAAVELNQAPPGTVQPYVAPNVILSLDDSTSMNADMLDSSGKSLGWRTTVLKNAVIDTFKDKNLLPDGKIRLAWQTMGNCTYVGSNTSSNKWAVPLDSQSATNKNVMRVLEGTHRINFLTYMENYRACTNTPTHDMVQRADAYMRASLHLNGPWASKPGVSETPYLGCRRNYHILLTDGGWNGTERETSPRNYDGSSQTLPDNTAYRTSSSQTQIYRDTESTTTISDWALYSWASPLQDKSKLQGNISPSPDYDKAPAQEKFTNRATGTTATLDRYWNPRYDPATWPHMSTFTIGFSNDALPEKNYSSNGTKKGDITAPSSMLPYGYDGSFADYANGTYVWRAASSDKGHDMWHAAINGRGQFYAVESGENLKKAFEQIIGTINTKTEPDMTSTATSGSNNTRYDVGKFTGNYEPKNGWKGFIKAETVRTDGSTAPTPGWNGQNTADKLDALNATGATTNTSNRLILSWSDKWVTDKYKGGVLFQWANDDSKLSSTQKAWLQKTPNGSGTDEGATAGQNRLNFIRGARTLEGSESNGYTAAKPFRERKSIQGDIINSIIWFTGPPSSNYPLKGYADFTRSKSSRTPMIYAGGNDGMLHGFSATDGTEKIAYIPQGIIPSLGRLTDPTYNQKHRNFVDGSPMTGDIYTGPNIETDTTPGANWKTMLVGSLGAGGKGYFVLDVTNPNSFSTTDASSLVKLDRTRSTDSAMSAAAAPNCALAGMISAEQTACTKAVLEDRDIGNIIATPVFDENNPMRTTQITRMNNNRWAVIMGNGYNSTTQRPVLLIQYLDNDMELKRIPVVGAVDASLADIGTGTGIASDNGLAAPRLIDLNGDGLPDIAYAGDNQGNMWKFDLTSADASNWGVAFSGQPLFTAQGPASLNSTRTLPQSITAPPTVRANDRKMTVGTGNDRKTVAIGGTMVAFGTGRNVTKADENNRNVQTIYSVLDNTRYNLITTSLGPRLQVNSGNASCTAPNGTCIPVPKALGAGVTTAGLAQQTITELDNGQFGTVGASNDDNKLSASTWANYNGWYLDLPAVGERQLKPMEFYDGSNILAIYSQVPAKGTDVDPNVESCDSSTVDEERQYRTFINIMDGLRPSVQIVDKNNDGLYNSLDLNVSRVKVSKGSHTLITQKNKIADIDTKNDKEMLARMPEQSLRPSWRQLR